MTIRRTRTGAFAIGLAAALALTACSGGSSMSSSNSTANTSDPAPRGVTLTAWTNSADSTALKNLYTAYENASGNKIDLVVLPAPTYNTAVQTKWATGARPDLLEWNGDATNLRALNPVKNMLDLSSLGFVKAEGDLAPLAGTLDGKTYGATLGPLSVFGMFYNKQVLAKAGLQAPTSYADLLSDCSVLKSKEPGVAPIFEAAGSGWPQSILAGFNYMGQYNADDAYAKAVAATPSKVTDPDGPFVKGMDTYTELRTKGCFNTDATTAKTEDALNALWSGKAATMAYTASDGIASLNTLANGDTASVDSKIGFAGVSATEPVANFTFSPLGTYYAPVTGDANKQRAATDFIQWVTTTGYQKYVDEAGVIPTMTGYTTPKLQGVMQEVEAAQKNATLTFSSDIPGFSPFGSESLKLTAGQASGAQVAKTMQAYVEQALAAAGN